jgi:hypothetical protein
LMKTRCYRCLKRRVLTDRLGSGMYSPWSRQFAPTTAIQATSPTSSIRNSVVCELVRELRDRVRYYIYVAEGGQNKPGWEQKTSPNVIKLIQTEDAVKAGGFFDIQGTTKSGVISFLKDPSCTINDISKSMSLDRAFLVKCGFAPDSFAHVSTYLFYTRSGIPRLLETYLSLEPAYTGAGMSVSKPCKTGD